jgi:hypothetical protein
MDFTKAQLSDVFIKHLDREKGLQELMEIMIGASMNQFTDIFMAIYMLLLGPKV